MFLSSAVVVSEASELEYKKKKQPHMLKEFLWVYRLSEKRIVKHLIREDPYIKEHNQRKS